MSFGGRVEKFVGGPLGGIGGAKVGRSRGERNRGFEAERLSGPVPQLETQDRIGVVGPEHLVGGLRQPLLKGRIAAGPFDRPDAVAEILDPSDDDVEQLGVFEYREKIAQLAAGERTEPGPNRRGAYVHRNPARSRRSSPPEVYSRCRAQDCSAVSVLRNRRSARAPPDPEPPYASAWCVGRSNGGASGPNATPSSSGDALGSWSH